MSVSGSYFTREAVAFFSIFFLSVMEYILLTLPKKYSRKVSNCFPSRKIRNIRNYLHHSHKKQQSGNLCVAIAYVIARIFRQCQTPQSAQIFFFTEKCSTLFVPPKIKYYHRLIENHQYRQTLLSMIDFFFLFFRMTVEA